MLDVFQCEGHVGLMAGNDVEIPDNWGFSIFEDGSSFDSHVSKELPWYPFATNLVHQVARHFIPHGGSVYELGSSTGNIETAFGKTLEERNASFTPIDEQVGMSANYKGKTSPLRIDFSSVKIPAGTSCIISFLSLMFNPIHLRALVISESWSALPIGGALIIVEKFVSANPRAAVIDQRIVWEGKQSAGVEHEGIIRKELSLAGIQVPLCEEELSFDGSECHEFFRVGNFSGRAYTKVA